MASERWIQAELPGFSEENQMWAQENTFRREHGFPEIALDDDGLPAREITEWPTAEKLRAILPSLEETIEHLRRMRLRVPLADSDTLKRRLQSVA